MSHKFDIAPVREPGHRSCHILSRPLTLKSNRATNAGTCLADLIPYMNKSTSNSSGGHSSSSTRVYGSLQAPAKYGVQYMPQPSAAQSQMQTQPFNQGVHLLPSTASYYTTYTTYYTTYTTYYTTYTTYYTTYNYNPQVYQPISGTFLVLHS